MENNTLIQGERMLGRRSTECGRTDRHIATLDIFPSRFTRFPLVRRALSPSCFKPPGDQKNMASTLVHLALFGVFLLGATEAGNPWR